MSKKAGFSLIEMVLAVAIMALASTGVMVYYNSFNSVQKTNSTKSELESSLILARNYAKSMQLPIGSVADMQYVEVDLTAGGQIVAGVNGVGSTYFNRDISASSVIITRPLVSQDVWFAPYSGKLIYQNGAVLEPRDVGYTINIGVSSIEGGETSTVLINASGLINGK
jgi:prepilin-type N-terminal cleavage/methylation domain-containing protein